MLLHLATAAELELARATGRHEPTSLSTEGFVHLSTELQMADVANEFYDELDDVVLLQLDGDTVGSDLRWEPAAAPRGGGAVEPLGRRFPHLYGPLPVAAIEAAHPWPRDADGIRRLPAVVGRAIATAQGVSYADAVADGHRLGAGFFGGWPTPPSPAVHRRVLDQSDLTVVAVDGAEVVGFGSALTDGVLCAVITLLEVLPGHRGRGIGTELVRRLLDRLRGTYAVDVACDPEVLAFYERFGMRPLGGAGIRAYRHQAGRGPAWPA